MLHFILFFNEEAKSHITIFSSYPIYPLPSYRTNCIQKELYGKKDGSIFKWNKTLNRISYRNIEC